MTNLRSDRAVVAYIASMAVILAFGIDASLPAFDELRTEFDLRNGSGEVSLVVTTYFLGMGFGQLIWGLSSDRIGRQKAMLAGLLLYGIGAAGAALAGSMTMLLVARVVWGLGAAAPSVLRNSVARDLYSGDKLAQITSMAMAIFLMGPAVAPAVGELILLSDNWRWVFAAAVPLAIAGMVWTFRFGETLDPANVRPLDLRSIAAGARTFFGNRAAFGHSLAITAASGAFFIFLGSSQPIVDEIYGHGDWFALIFACVAACIGLTVWNSGRFIRGHGARKVALVAVIGMIAAAAAFGVVAVATDGRPPFWFWLGAVAVFASLGTVSTPTMTAMAMTPMARVAGTASALNGVLSVAGASLLAVVFDRRIDDTVTPMAVGFLVYSLLALGFLLWARGGSDEIVEPVERATVSR
ncbi:MAG: MFS transporter [Acidimicrobiales bacterium]|nr:MAG: MFS transporter [Acidimicrobiales bacterium]